MDIVHTPESIAKANFYVALDQAETDDYDTVEEALEAHHQNAFDTAEGLGLDADETSRLFHNFRNAMGKTTPEDVEASIEAARRASIKSHDTCKAYAEQECGWSRGDRVRHLSRRGGVNLAEVVGFLGVHPTQWAARPLVRARAVRKDGTAGKREVLIEIDTDGRWRKRWARA